MNRFLAKAHILAQRFDNEDEIMEQAQYKWNEANHTFSKDIQIDENTVSSEPITAEEYYKNSEF